MTQLRPIADQVIVITGGSSGIGLATAERAVAKGASVVLAARNSEALDTIADRLGREKVEVIAVDVADDNAAVRIADAALARFGRVDSWVNNAAAALYAKVVDASLEEHRRVFDVGYFGLVQGSLKAASLMRERGGAIINVGSVLSYRAVPYQGTYSAMKHAVRGFTDALRMELAMEGRPISVSLIKPNGMDTPYPEHARNLMGKPARIPPIVYDPRLVAKAICHACTVPVREMTVGGQGLLVSHATNLAPGLTDAVMEHFMGKTAQTIDEAPPPGTNDNLFEPRADGRIDSEQDIHVRRSSLWLTAQMHPLATAAAGVGAVAAGLLTRGMIRRR